MHEIIKFIKKKLNLIYTYNVVFNKFLKEKKRNEKILYILVDIFFIQLQRKKLSTGKK